MSIKIPAVSPILCDSGAGRSQMEDARTDGLDADVLIAGGGPVGLTAALCLARLGVTSIVMERDSETARAPKARAVNTRSMEIFRALGIERAVAAGALPLDSWRFLFFDHVSGPEWARVEDPVDVGAHFSPTYRRTVMQSDVEEVLADQVAASRQAQLLFRTELRSLCQDERSVTATVCDLNAQELRELRGRFMIGADGTQSVVRPQLGVELVGESGLAFAATIHHRTNLGPWLADRPSTLVMTTGGEGRPRITGVVRGNEEWVTMFIVGDTPGNRLEDLDESRCQEIVRDVVGVSDIETEILNVGSFATNFQLATRFREGRVFLAGDAAHRVPPAGGFGMNIGVQSAHNLAWKLAAVLRGEAADALLDTYDPERRSVAEEVGGWSHENGPRMAAILRARMMRDDRGVVTAADEMENYVRNIGMDLGVCYATGALVPEANAHPPLEPSVYRPSTRPGARAPHCWLERDGHRISTLDLFGKRFVLLGNAGNPTLRTTSAEVERELGLRVETLGVGPSGELGDQEPSFAKLYDVPERGAVLVRPDGYVAWRCEVLRTGALVRVLRGILGHRGAET